MKHLTITDERMLQLPEILKADGRINHLQEFWDMAGIARQNIPNIKRGHQRFTVDHIQNVCYGYGINANWINGLEQNIYRLPPIVSSRVSVNKTVNKRPEKQQNSKNRKIINKPPERF